MVTMAVAYEEIPVRPGGFTIADLDDLPADGRRYELLDGVLLVSPPPRWEHQWGVTELHRVLHSCCPADLHAFPVPLEVSQGDDTYFEPDVIVVRDSDLVDGVRFRALPVLVAEMLSPSSRSIDQVLKRHAYARIGVPHYWIVDYHVPAITALTLVDGGYVETASATGDAVFTADEPFPVRLRPSDLRRRA
jgi:Uma2 family endonuclease